MKNFKTPSTYSFNEEKQELLSHLKPAATKLIIDNDTVEIIELIKVKLFDLILKQVLILKKDYRKLHPNNRHIRVLNN